MVLVDLIKRLTEKQSLCQQINSISLFNELFIEEASFLNDS